MLFIEALTADTTTLEYFNLDNIISIKPLENGTTKILMGAGLSWRVHTDTIKIVNITEVYRNA